MKTEFNEHNFWLALYKFEAIPQEEGEAEGWQSHFLYIPCEN